MVESKRLVRAILETMQRVLDREAPGKSEAVGHDALRGAVLRECGELRAMPRALQEQAFDAAMRAVGRLGAACKGGKSDRSPKGSGGRSKNKPLAFRRVR